MSSKPKKFVVRVTRTARQHVDVPIRASSEQGALDAALRRHHDGKLTGWSEPDVREADYEILRDEEPS